MQPITPTLLEVQQAMRRALADRDEVEAALHVVEDGISPAVRLDIYRNTSVGVLANALRLSYPAVQRLVGVEFFESAARLFIEEHPAQSAWLDEYGGDFSDFLSQLPSAATLPYLSDVARLEWAVTRALHAADADPLDVATLAKLDEAARACVRFVFHPSLSLIRCDCPADTLWRAVLDQDDTSLASFDPAAEPVWLLIERGVAGVEVTRLSEAAWRFTSELHAGKPMHTALDEAVGAEMSGLLAQHLAAGRFTEFRLDGNTVVS